MGIIIIIIICGSSSDICITWSVWSGVRRQRFSVSTRLKGRKQSLYCCSAYSKISRIMTFENVRCFLLYCDEVAMVILYCSDNRPPLSL